MIACRDDMTVIDDQQSVPMPTTGMVAERRVVRKVQHAGAVSMQADVGVAVYCHWIFS
jgi:hypothetical protein